MADQEAMEALRVDLWVPVASFRDPLFPGVGRCLPVAPPSTVAGMLGAVVGSMDALGGLRFGTAFRADGGGEDLETYQRIERGGTNPAVLGRASAAVQKRGFLAHAHLTVWLADSSLDRWERAWRRPVWPLRLGRSQDVAHVVGLEREWLEPCDRATVGYALVPEGAAEVSGALELRLATSVSPDRLRTMFATFGWVPSGGGEAAVRGALRSPEGQAVWLALARP